MGCRHHVTRLAIDQTPSAGSPISTPSVLLKDLVDLQPVTASCHAAEGHMPRPVIVLGSEVVLSIPPGQVTGESARGRGDHGRIPRRLFVTVLEDIALRYAIPLG